MVLVHLVAVVLLTITFITSNCNDVPVIGVIPQPCIYNGVNGCRQEDKNAYSYVAGSYIQWLQMSGAEIIPLYFSYTESQLSTLLPQLNGVMITGGSAPTDPKTPYEKFVQYIMAFSRNYHKKNANKSFPIWGTCDGFENMMTAVAKGGESVMGNFDATSLNLAVTFNQSTIGDSVMFDMNNKESMYYPFKQLIINLATNKNITYNDHNNGITPKVFYNDEYVRTNFTSLGTSFDRNGLEFITLVESQKQLGLKWYASQFHPEKSSFEFSRNEIVHTYDAVLVNAWFSNFFVDQCRMANDNVMNTKQFKELTIYNFNPIWTDSTFEEMYVFEK